ncbi:hypothetical protein NN561_010032 [Cricetulus griseus]
MEAPGSGGGDSGGDPGGDGTQPDARGPGSGPCAAARESERQLRLRLCVLNEILGTERDYVGTLRFLQSFENGYICAAATRGPVGARVGRSWDRGSVHPRLYRGPLGSAAVPPARITQPQLQTAKQHPSAPLYHAPYMLGSQQAEPLSGSSVTRVYFPIFKNREERVRLQRGRVPCSGLHSWLRVLECRAVT